MYLLTVYPMYKFQCRNGVDLVNSICLRALIKEELCLQGRLLQPRCLAGRSRRGAGGVPAAAGLSPHLSDALLELEYVSEKKKHSIV